MARSALIPVAIALAIAGCSSNATRQPSGSVCPPDSTLTYEGFARPFMEMYCTECHSSELHGADRKGAPLFHDFDSEFGIVVVGDHVDEYAAAGPDAVNTMMPPGDPKPTLEERQQLGEYVACALEHFNDPQDAGADAL